MNKYKPGPGWKHLGGAVWEHPRGGRIHTYGVVRMRCGKWLDGARWPQSRDVFRFVQINGGSRKRGLMAWALSQLTDGQES